MAVVVLLGAGASFGSVGVEPYAPPLGNGLFNDLVERGGVASTLPQYIKQLFKANFEVGMAEYFKYSNGNIMTFQRELAYYLASFEPTDSNIYLNIINELSCQRVVYSSLNYDLLFELSAAKLGIITNYSSKYEKGKVRLLKIHGSSNFWPDMPTGTIGTTSFSNCGIDIMAPIKPLNQIETINKCKQEKGIAPAIAMFAEGKAVRVSPDFVQIQYRMWKEQVNKSSSIFIIGVRVHEVDEHIWSILGNSKAKVTYFGFDSDEAEFKQWKINNNKNNAYFYNSDFENSVQIIKGLYQR